MKPMAHRPPSPLAVVLRTLAVEAVVLLAFLGAVGLILAQAQGTR